MSKTNSAGRNQRNNPYVLDDLFVSFHRSAAGVAWRWRAELALLAVILAALWRLSVLITLIWAAVTLGGLALVLVVVPVTRRFLARRFWCVLSRHRLQRVCYETRMHTRTGRLPLVVWIRPTRVGERAYVLCRAGICAEDFADNAAEIAAACFAREARVTGNLQWSHLVTIDIIRRDLLAPKRIIPAAIAPGPGQLDDAAPVFTLPAQRHDSEARDLAAAAGLAAHRRLNPQCPQD